MQINLLSALASFVGSPINRGGVVGIVLFIILPLFIGRVNSPPVHRGRSCEDSAFYNSPPVYRGSTTKWGRGLFLIS